MTRGYDTIPIALPAALPSAVSKTVSRRAAARTLAAGTLAAGTLVTGPALSGASLASAALDPAASGSAENTDRRILALARTLQNNLVVRRHTNAAMEQGRFQDYYAEREALDARIKRDLVTLRALQPTGTRAVQERYLAFSTACFTVWQPLT